MLITANLLRFVLPIFSSSDEENNLPLKHPLDPECVDFLRFDLPTRQVYYRCLPLCHSTAVQHCVSQLLLRFSILGCPVET